MDVLVNGVNVAGWTKKPAPAWEAKACSRCNGIGRVPHRVAAGICFKCNGAGWFLTTRGRAAARHFTALCSIPVYELRPGHVLRVDGMTLGGSLFRYWNSIQATHFDLAAGSVEVVFMPHKLAWGQVTRLTLKATDTVRVGQGAADKADKIKQALAYQATLTKSGTPRKRTTTPKEV